jgi:predicted RNA binding protein YcfA (HicA-like mRNA interferase family)
MQGAWAMTKRDKRIAKMRQNPKNVTFDEVDVLLLSLGFRKRQKGSHAVYTLGASYSLTIPFRKPFVLPIYVLEILRLYDALSDAEDE